MFLSSLQHRKVSQEQLERQCDVSIFMLVKVKYQLMNNFSSESGIHFLIHAALLHGPFPAESVSSLGFVGLHDTDLAECSNEGCIVCESRLSSVVQKRWQLPPALEWARLLMRSHQSLSSFTHDTMTPLSHKTPRTWSTISRLCFGFHFQKLYDFESLKKTTKIRCFHVSAVQSTLDYRLN